MKKAGLLSYLFGLLALLSAAAAVYAAVCFRDAGPVLLEAPEEAQVRVEQLMTQICEGNFQKAEQMLLGNPDLGADGMPEDPVDAMIWQAYLDSLDYRLVGEVYATDTGLAQNVKLIGMELETVTQNLGSRAQALLDQTMASAEDVSELYNEKNEYREDLVMDVLKEAARQALEEDVRYGYQILSLPLVYSDGQWWVEAPEGSGNILEKYEMHMTNVRSDALEGILSIDKVYWLHDEDLVAPKPDPDNYGQTDEPKQLRSVIRSADAASANSANDFHTSALYEPFTSSSGACRDSVCPPASRQRAISGSDSSVSSPPRSSMQPRRRETA